MQLNYQESDDHKRCGWYAFVGKDVIVSLKQSGRLYRARYCSDGQESAKATIKRFIETGKKPNREFLIAE